MKKNYLFLSIIILSLLAMRSFSYQPAEHGLIFGEKIKANTNNKSKKNLNKSNMTFVCEKRSNGRNSLVLRVNGLSKFLALAVNCTQPIIVRIFSDDKQYRDVFQNVADKFKDKAVFVSFDSLANEPLSQVFLYVLKSKGVNLPQGNEFFPMFVFCNSDFVLLTNNNSVGFNKDSLKLLAVRFLRGEADFLNMVNKAFAQIAQIPPQNAKEDGEAKANHKQQKTGRTTFWKGIKNWFK